MGSSKKHKEKEKRKKKHRSRSRSRERKHKKEKRDDRHDKRLKRERDEDEERYCEEGEIPGLDLVKKEEPLTGRWTRSLKNIYRKYRRFNPDPTIRKTSGFKQTIK